MLVVAMPGSLFVLHPICSQCCDTDVGHGHVRTLFLSLILFLVRNPNYIMLYWPSAN